MCLFVFLFAHKEMCIKLFIYKYMVLNVKFSKDEADSLRAVYYHIWCNYIITANHPPEVAVLSGNALLQNKHCDLNTYHTH